MAIPMEEFRQRLADSGLMPDEEIAALIAAMPAGNKPPDGEQLARELVRLKKLTAHQAKEICAGRGKELVLGNYVILDKLGQGGMGLVLKAAHRRMKRLVALKVLSPKVVRTPEALRRFQREVQAVARLTHPNIVIADEAGGTHFLAMEYVEGRDLSSWVRQDGVLSLGQALDCILQAARGLQYAHEHGVVHRDIKPANLLLAATQPVPVLEKPKPQPMPPWNLPPGSPPTASAPFDAAQARAHQEAWAKRLGVEVEMVNSIGMRFMLIPPGEFDRGSTDEEIAELLEDAEAANQPDWYIDRLLSEAPRHRVRISKPFWLGRHEVTRGQFRRFVEDSGYQTEAARDGQGGSTWNSDLAFPQTDDHPVVPVSWHDATAFCQWLSAKAGETYCLPTETEWEYACRAGTMTRYSFGDDAAVLGDYAWWANNSTKGGTQPVGQLRSNAFGLYDMHGNVWEWCSDRFGGYTTSRMSDSTGPAAGSRRINRGGSWDYDVRGCRSARRGGDSPSDHGPNLGFRVASRWADVSDP